MGDNYYRGSGRSDPRSWDVRFSNAERVVAEVARSSNSICGIKMLIMDQIRAARHNHE